MGTMGTMGTMGGTRVTLVRGSIGTTGGQLPPELRALLSGAGSTAGGTTPTFKLEPATADHPAYLSITDCEGDKNAIRLCEGKLQWWGAQPRFGKGMECMSDDIEELRYANGTLSIEKARPPRDVSANVEGMHEEPAFIAALLEIMGDKILIDHEGRRIVARQPGAAATPPLPSAATNRPCRQCGCVNCNGHCQGRQINTLRAGHRTFAYRF